ncbi:MAG: glutamine-hydrolyzing GMP synthase, partial [Candidatus Marinimicrobia bacterium]|nr:glutamine-hydrolyzing GMP synthase [Candidatus Neomarinimicrobiota bacterium]
MNHLHAGGVVILDFGSQYTQLIARRIREQNVFSEILPSNTNIKIIMERKPKALILSGGPSSVFEKTAPQFDINIFDIDIPILGICYGFHLLAHHYGGKVESGIQGEYGLVNIHLDQSDSILYGISDGTQVWMSHMDKVQELPKGWSVLAKSSNGMVAAMASVETKRYATQFHPEVAHTVEGESIINNFLFKLACCEPNWTAGNFIHEQIETIQNHVGDGKVICGVSGGVDSSVVSALIHKAVGSQCTSVLIDHGMLRKNEASHCISALKDGLGVNILSFDESDVFLSNLSGVIEPEKKRKIIGEQFIRSFEKVAA